MRVGERITKVLTATGPARGLWIILTLAFALGALIGCSRPTPSTSSAATADATCGR